MASLSEAQARLLELRSARDDARAAVRQEVFAVRSLDDAIAQAERAGRRGQAEVEKLRAQRDDAAREVDWRKAALSTAQLASRAAAATLLETDPQRLIEQMDDSVPFLLLPVRIETKFAGDAGSRQLLVRVFPDDAAVSLHEKALTESEADAGRAYWKSRAQANALPAGPDRANARKGAWNVLASRYGPYRASWIAKSLEPVNWSDTVTDPAALHFPAVATKPASWTEAPRSFVLPDRFVAVLFSGTQRMTSTGALIPDDLVLGPDPLQSEGLLTRDPATGRITIDEDLKWLVDFDRAVELGMALRVPLAPPWDALAIERLVVLGLKASAGAPQGRQFVESLFESHRYSRGMSILPQGSPTNNTDSAASGYTTSSDASDEAFDTEENAAAITETADPLVRTDGQRLSDALGISLDAARVLPHAAGTDGAEAIAMNRALWAATLGGYLRDMIEPLVDDAMIAAAERFFTTCVLGRGGIPAVRIGSQPYGILAASSLSAWQPAPADGQDAIQARLLALLPKLDGVWRRLAGNVAYIGKPGDPFDNLLTVIGLQASSVEYYARKAVSDDYLWNYMRFKATPQAYATDVWEELQREKNANLAQLGLGVSVPFQLKQLTFWREHDQLTGPVVDGDPTVPLSEEKKIRPYDASHNYIDWLLAASRSDLETETFTGQDGKPVDPPKALLYQMLRHAYLAELGRAGVNLLKNRDPAVFAELPPEPVIANVGSGKSLALHDLMNTDTAKIGLTPASGTVADYLLGHARAGAASPGLPPEAIPLAGMSDSLKLLAGLPTARLERLFAEHVDLCGYRLDAWIHGLFSLRLERLRGGRQQTGGIYLGAFGWVENLMPNTGNRRPVSLEELPPALQKDMAGAVVEYANNGGYVHAPSLTQAVSAAVLRNAYLTHAEPSRAQVMSVNLSSSRVRTALATLDGLRNGQDLAALLGYQLERGLHEGHPGVELDQFVYVLRERFPLISKKLTPVPDGQPAEVIEARNVVNGYDLLDFVRGKAYPYGIAGLPADPAQAAAIQAEIDRLADTMDAIADLMLAESVHQAVQGNYDRGRGVLQSITEGESPPEIEIVKTPRSGRALTHRVALPLDPSKTSGWGETLTPRAAAAAPLNAWLATILPAANRIQWKATRGLQAPEFVSLDSLGLEPLDAVLMCGERFGDLSSEVERFLVYEYRRSRGIPDTMRTFFFEKTDPGVADADALVLDPGSAGPDGVPLASLCPLLKALRSLVCRSRPLDANDFQLPSEAQDSDPANPKGYDNTVPPLQDLGELRGRAEAAFTSVKALVDDLDTFLTGTVQPLFDALENDPNHTVGPPWNAVLPALRRKLVSLCVSGSPEALPTSGLAATEPVIAALVRQGQAVVKFVRQRLAAARELLDFTFTDPLPSDPDEAARAKGSRLDIRVEKYSDAAKLLLGQSFVLIPLYKLHASGRPELAAAIATPVESDPLAVEEWLQPLSRVRGPIEALARVAAYHDWLHADPLAFVPAQLPVRLGDQWIGTAYGASLGPGEVVSLLLCDRPADVAAPQCGLLFDEWTEVVPTEKETTGIAFHDDRPNAQPPQVLLLAVAPDLRGAWRWDDLLSIVTETLDRAKSRAVEPDMLAATEYFQVLPAVLTEFSSGRPFLSTVLAYNAVARLQT